MTEATNNTSAPVAWQLQLPDGRVTLEKAFPFWAAGSGGYAIGDGYTITPLYTAPPAAAVVPQCLQHFLDHKFAQLAVFEDGRTPLYLTEEQYNSIRSLLARLNPAPDHSEHALGMVPEGYALVPAEPTAEMRQRAQGYLAVEGIIASDWLINTAYRELLAAAPTPEPASPWISVEERLPDQKGFVLARSIGVIDDERQTGTLVLYYSNIGKESERFHSQHRATHVTVTHWMPLPAAPEQPAKEQGQ